MRTYFLTLLTGIFSLGLFVSHAAAITGGQVDEGNRYSNVGALVFTGDVPGQSFDPFAFATGTLIHPRVFLTAGHTTISLPKNPVAIQRLIRVSFGKDALDRTTWREIDAVITHPGYQDLGTNNPHINDVGVIILRDPVCDLPLAKLPYEGFLDDLKAAHLLREPSQGGTPFTVAGYGTSLDWPPPEIVPGDGLRRFAQTEYLTLTQSWLFTQQNPATGNGGTGFGDSGGPTFWIADDGTLVLVALTSRGNSNCVSTNIAWRVDIPETLDFVEFVIAVVEEADSQ